jgi:hypothetical protein
MAAVTDQTGDPVQATGRPTADAERDPTPGERRLARPPSDRYRSTDATAEAPAAPAPGSLVRAALWADLAAFLGAAATVVLGGVLAVSAGLLVVAAATGWAIGQAVRAGGGQAVARDARSLLAIGSAGLAVIVGQLGLWLYAGTEGGVLPLVDYLAQTFGFLVPLQAIVAIGVAWWTAR